jgi:hypothetical protein
MEHYSVNSTYKKKKKKKLLIEQKNESVEYQMRATLQGIYWSENNYIF